MTQEEQLRLYRLMDKLNWFFHQGALSGSGHGGANRTGVLSGDSDILLRYFMGRAAPRGAGEIDG